MLVAEAGKARVRAVTFGGSNAVSALVKDGVKSGETVFLHPGSTMAMGKRYETGGN